MITGLLVAVAATSAPASHRTQTAPAGDTFVCVHVLGQRADRTLPRRFESTGAPCTASEERMRVVVLMTTPFQSDPTPPASPRDQEHPSATRDSSIAVTRRALLPTSAALLVETTIVADGHGALLAPSGSSAGPLTVSLSCTTFIDGQPGGGSIAFSLPGATGLGSPPIDPEGNQEGAKGTKRVRRFLMWWGPGRTDFGVTPPAIMNFRSSVRRMRSSPSVAWRRSPCCSQSGRSSPNGIVRLTWSRTPLIRFGTSEKWASQRPGVKRSIWLPNRLAVNVSFKVSYVVPEVGLEPTRDVIPRDFESRASANFTTPARERVYQGDLPLDDVSFRDRSVFVPCRQRSAGTARTRAGLTSLSS